jgi:hypothetical protein
VTARRQRVERLETVLDAAELAAVDDLRNACRVGPGQCEWLRRGLATEHSPGVDIEFSEPVERAG